MNKRALILLLSLPFSTLASDKAIYGVDNRIDLNDSNVSTHRELGKSVAAMIPLTTVVPGFLRSNPTPKTTEFFEVTLQDSMQLCADERFSHQQAVAECTAFLVSPTHLATAGHCVPTLEACQSSLWVFDYQLKTEKDDFIGEMPDSSIYRCKSVLDRKLTIFTNKDWAVIELDRLVTGRRPLKLSKSAPAKNDPLFVIGTPSGLPLKVASGEVRSKHSNYFKTNLDTFAGNSGSPVFNGRTNEVEGILVRGDTDYEYAGTCIRASGYGNNSGRGEDVSYIKDIRSLLKL